mmetsp:Transcript_39494/g.91199  ORF Transcript_39494/g.91199 Transcript_39494/m.91199 type:complete len:409 (-) Transcript_39494:109-1335(-)
MPNLEAHQQVQCDSNECASDAGESLSSWQNVPSEVSGSSGIPPSQERWAADLAAIRGAQRHQHLELSEKHLQQLKNRTHDAEEAFRKEWQLTHDRLGSASMASHLEACLEKARAAPLEHSTGLLGQYAAWHQEVLQLEEKIKQKEKETAVSEDQPSSCTAEEEPQTWEPQRQEASGVVVKRKSIGVFFMAVALAVGALHTVMHVMHVTAELNALKDMLNASQTQLKAMQTTVAKMPTWFDEESRPLVAMEAALHAKTAAMSKHSFDVFVHLDSYDDEYFYFDHKAFCRYIDMRLIHTDGNWGSAVKFMVCRGRQGQHGCFDDANMERLQGFAKNLLISGGFSGRRWTYVQGDKWEHSHCNRHVQHVTLAAQQPLNYMDGSAKWFQEWLMTSGEFITEAEVTPAAKTHK